MSAGSDPAPTDVLSYRSSFLTARKTADAKQETLGRDPQSPLPASLGEKRHGGCCAFPFRTQNGGVGKGRGHNPFGGTRHYRPPDRGLRRRTKKEKRDSLDLLSPPEKQQNNNGQTDKKGEVKHYNEKELMTRNSGGDRKGCWFLFETFPFKGREIKYGINLCIVLCRKSWEHY